MDPYVEPHWQDIHAAFMVETRAVFSTERCRKA